MIFFFLIFFFLGGGQEVQADQCLWFKMHKKRPFDFILMGMGERERCLEKQVRHFPKNIQDLGLILL